MKMNPELKVFKELPEKYEADPLGFSDKEAKIKHEFLREPLDQLERMHFCYHCDGWIPGHPIREGIHEPLVAMTGRQGTSYQCARCGYEICFVGKRA